jgi:hypothetical protein
MQTSELVSRSIAGLQACAGVAFLAAGWQADRALDKAGFGDPLRAMAWNRRAEFAFYAFIGLWLIGIAWLLFRQVAARRSGNRGFSLLTASVTSPAARYAWIPPLALGVGWLIMLL